MRVLFRFIVIFMILFLTLPEMSFALDTGAYTQVMQPNGGDAALINSAGGKILGVVQVIGIGVALIMLLVIAMKYFTGSVEEKAQYKERLVPYFIGAVLLFGGITFMSIFKGLIK